MDELGYEWYTGFRTPRAVGATVKEALDTYVKDADGAKKEVEDAPTVTAPLTRSPLEFTGINVEINNKDQLEMLDKTNKSIERWLPMCMLHVSRVRCDTPTSTKDEKSGGGSSNDDEDDQCEVSTIRLQTAHHVTLFFYSTCDPRTQLEDPVVKQVYDEMQQLGPEMRKLRDTLTPYEFAIAMLYRSFYKIKLPFEQQGHDGVDSGKDSLAKEVPVFLKHVVFVPGVVMCATALLGKDVVSIPAEDGGFGPYDTYGRGDKRSIDGFVKQCIDGETVMVNEDHCTHVTLGVTKTYKPVVSNNVCQGIRDYLQYVEKHASDARASEGLLYIKKVTASRTICDLEPKRLIECLQVYSSGYTEYKHAKRSFVELTPHLVNDGDETALMETAKRTVFETSLKPTQASADKHCYKRTMCFVSEDMEWVYIRHLPLDRDMGHGKGTTGNNWVVDAYMCTINKAVKGQIQFYSH